jgi:hypothetical protein
MASRLMLSLKKAASKPKPLLSLEIMSNPTWGGSVDDGTVRFAVPERSPLTPVVPSEEEIELGAALQDLVPQP